MISVETAVRDWTSARFPAARVATEIPSTLQSDIPVIRVWRLGGPSLLTLDRALMAVDYFDYPRDNARQGAEQVRDAFLFELPGTITGGLVINRVTCESAPAWAPYDDTANIRRFTASYTVIAKTA